MKRDASYLWNLTISRFASEPKIGSFAEIANLSISKRSIFLDGVTLSRVPRPAGPPKSIATPCVMVCAVDGESGLCLGCFRTLGEIAGWRAAGMLPELDLVFSRDVTGGEYVQDRMHVRADVLRLAPLVADFLNHLEPSLEPA